MVRLISYTMWNPDIMHLPASLEGPEGIMAYTARVSSNNQENPDYVKLLSYCMKHGHWSVFEMADATMEIKTSRAIARQILRHRSFQFQEFSQRYQSLTDKDMLTVEARRQDAKNRQNSIADMSEEDKRWWEKAQAATWSCASKLYQQALDKGIAKEQARALLPEGMALSKMYMKGSLRAWVHYLNVRLDVSTQLEHRQVAEEIKEELYKSFPTVMEAASKIYPLLEKNT